MPVVKSSDNTTTSNKYKLQVGSESESEEKAAAKQQRYITTNNKVQRHSHDDNRVKLLSSPNTSYCLLPGLVCHGIHSPQ